MSRREPRAGEGHPPLPPEPWFLARGVLPPRDPRGREYFWLTGEFVNAEPEAEDTDEWALAHGYVSVVPVQVDLTDYGRLTSLGEVLK